MSERNIIIIDVESWRLALLAVKRDILDADPVAALRRIDALLAKLAIESDIIAPVQRFGATKIRPSNTGKQG